MSITGDAMCTAVNDAFSEIEGATVMELEGPGGIIVLFWTIDDPQCPTRIVLRDDNGDVVATISPWS